MRASNKRVWLVALGLAAYVGIFVLPRTSQPAAAEPSKSEAVGAEELPRPAFTTAATKSRKRATVAPAIESVAATPSPEVDPPSTFAGDIDHPYERTAPTPLSEADLEIRAAERRMLGSRWSAQSTDMEWTAAMTDKANQALADENAPPHSVRAIDCRKTICRLELAAVGGENALKLIYAARTLHNETWVDHHEGEDDAWTIEVFVSHPEYRLSGDGGKI